MVVIFGLYDSRLLEGNASLIAAVQQHLDSWDIFDEDIPYDPDYFVDANDPGTQELEGTPSQEASATATVSSSPGSSISSAQLATALARAQGRPSTLPVSESPSSSASLFGIPQASPISPLWPPYPQQPGTAQNQHHVTSPTIATISSEALTRALAGARASTETPAPTRWAQVTAYINCLCMHVCRSLKLYFFNWFMFICSNCNKFKNLVFGIRLLVSGH
jgi:hypothetical protein